MQFDLISFIIGVLVGVGLLGVGFYLGWDDWFR